MTLKHSSELVYSKPLENLKRITKRCNVSTGGP